MGAVRHLTPRIGAPEAAIVLGSGLGQVASRLQDAETIPYGQIPGFPVTGVLGHAGRLHVGALGGVRVAVLQGRVHAYEGWSPDQVVMPVRTMVLCGARQVVLTNAAGAIAEGLLPGDLMVVRDQINFTGRTPLEGPNPNDLGTRFPPMSDLYDPELRSGFMQAARGRGRTLREGTYLGCLGPAYETPAEIRMMKALGADAVGMSTVMEAAAARHLGASVLGVSCMTNLAAGLSQASLDHSEVFAVAGRLQGLLSELLEAYFRARPWETAGIAKSEQNR